ncbi:MAG TPA: hypothetical protein VFR47_18795 [Anaerolineales bacterium]|nr:hypothetical protein [Anaerolineales bacterium]
MRKHLTILVLMISILAACAPQAQPTEEPVLPNDNSYPNDSYPNDSYPNQGLTLAQQAAIAALSKILNVPPGQITLISTEAVNWPDGCLGVQRAGVMCTQAIVPGYKIILEANGTQYEVHTDEDGSSVVVVPNTASAGSLEEMVKKQLAMNLGLEESSVSIVSSSDVEFSDSCLGVAMQDVMCAQVITPGKIIVLEAEGVEYTYHVSVDGSLVQPATLALTWRREGGIAGFCDSLTVFLSGEIYGNQCKSQPNGTMGTFASLLSVEEREQFDAWIQEFGTVLLDASDPQGVSDRMEVKLEFFGKGNGSLSQSDEQELILWAQNVFQKLYQ